MARWSMNLAAAGLALLLAPAGLVACQGCQSKSGAAPGPAPSGSALQEIASLRIYVLSNLAGALEPCGCTRDQLGGIDRLGSYIAKEAGRAKASMLLAVGPTAFTDTKLDAARAKQDEWKAEALGDALGALGLAAWTPGYNDWIAGAPTLARVAGAARAPLIAANLKGDAAGVVPSVLREVGGIAVGLVGVSKPVLEGAPPPGVTVDDPTAAMQKAVADLRSKGAKLLVGLASVPRGEALRLAEAVPDLSVLIVGKPVDRDETNDAAPLPRRLGNTLVVETSNHLQTVAAIDVFIRGGDFVLQDGSGVSHQDEIASLSQRSADLSARIGAWETAGSLPAKEIQAKKAELAELAARKARLATPPPPPSGSFFRYTLVEVRDGLGREPKIRERMAAYYRRVNEHNKQAFADREPPPLAKGQTGYVGVMRCSTCHAEARAVWDRTQHARAYETLAAEFKEYNLECVGCHVTGYEKPGGSTVTKNAQLQGVQCESCHGPGAAHSDAPTQKGLIARTPNPSLCATSCHHPPHVEGFDATAKLKLVLGPGHGEHD